MVAVSTLAPAGSVVLDPGHGGTQQGALGVCGMAEKELVLDVSQRVARYLRGFDLKVNLTRNDDRDLELAERVGMARRLGADLFVSIHANASPNPKVRGTETFVATGGEEGHNAAARALVVREEGPTESSVTIDSNLAQILGDLQRAAAQESSVRMAGALQAAVSGAVGSSARGVESAPFFVLRHLETPAVLLELGFFDPSSRVSVSEV